MADSLQSIPLSILVILLLVPLAGSFELAANDRRLKDEFFKPVEGSIFIHQCNTSSTDAFWTNNESFSKKEKTLSFMSINRTDSGWYYCFKTQKKKILLETIYIDVQYPARILAQSKGNNPVHENQTFSLEVKVEGKPPPNTTFTSDIDGSVTFWQDGEGSITVVVYRMQCSDGGPYHVTATNSLANDSRAQEIQVFCAPGMSPRAPSQELHPRLGENVELKVFTMGFPFPNVTWTHSGKIVLSENNHFESNVMLSDFSIDDFGLYSIQMVNDLGQFNGTYHVTADGPPGPVTRLSVTHIMAESVNISWVSGFDNGSSQNFIISSFNGTSNNVLANVASKKGDHGPRPMSQVLDGLHQGKSYNVSIVANNSHGETPMASRFFEFTAATPTRYNVTEGNSLFVKSFEPNVHWQSDDGAYTSKTNQLAIYNATRNYTGSYTCIEDTSSTIIAVTTAFVDVQYPAKILQAHVLSTDVMENDTYVITVTVDGNPVPETTLTQSGKVLFRASKTGVFNMSVSYVRCSEFYSVMLTSSNSLGNDNRSEEMRVHCPPSPKAGLQSQFKPRLGDDVMLKIENVGYPYPVYTWEFNGKVLGNETGEDADVFTVDDVQIQDFGSYDVKMRNNLGSSTYNFSVIADGPPDPVMGLTVNNVTMFSANISFMSGYDYGARQTFTIQALNGESYDDIGSFEDDSKDHLPRTVSHVITDLEVGTKYNISVVPKNSRGKGQRSSTFVSFTTKVPTDMEETIEGENVTIPCNASGTNDTHWETKNGTILTTGPVLEIYFITRNYTGMYKCVGKTDFINDERVLEDAYIDVQYPAKILNISAGPNYLEANDTFMIELLVEGHPTPNIALLNTRTGAVVFSSNQTGALNVTMESVQCTDLGTYQLTVSNRLGNESRKEDIYVYCPPVVDPNAHVQTSFYPRIGNQTTIKIENYGYPYPNYTWHHNKFAIAKHIDSEFGSSIDLNVTASDFGSYDVDMTNEYGDVTVTFQVIPKGVPDPVTDMKVDNFTYNSAVLSWTSGFNYGSQQTFLLQRQDNGKYVDLASYPDRSAQGLERGDYTVTGLDSSTLYTLTVVSGNRDGNSIRSRGTLQFTTAAAPSHHKNHHTGAIVGGVIGSLCALGLLVAIFLKIRKNRRRKYQNLEEE